MELEPSLRASKVSALSINSHALSSVCSQKAISVTGYFYIFIFIFIYSVLGIGLGTLYK